MKLHDERVDVCVVAPYVKVYLMDGKNCVEKQKTMTARRTLDPLYQQQLCFTMPYNGKILQVGIANLICRLVQLCSVSS